MRLSGHPGDRNSGGYSRKRTLADLLLLSACVAAITFLICGMFGPVDSPPVQVSQPTSVDPTAPPILGTGFAENAVFPTTRPLECRGTPPHLYGSWLHTDATTGQVVTNWYPGDLSSYVFVAGYPNQPGNNLYVELSDGSKTRILSYENPGESWHLASLSIPARGRFRIVAIDGSKVLGGWLAFSLPFEIRPDNPYLLRQIALAFITAAASLLFFLAPGLLLRQRRPVAFIWVPFIGLIALALVGLIAWILPHAISPIWVSRAALSLFALYATWRLWRMPLAQYTDLVERRALLMIALLVAIGTAKASYSVPLAGELFRGTIARTLEVGGLSDSRLSYHPVQLIAFQRKPFSDYGKALYAHYGGWNFSHRGALISLTVAPVVLSGPVEITQSMPIRNWTIFDPDGFGAYRIAMIAIAACSLLSVFGLAKLLLPDDWALLAFLVTVSAPFVVHEVYFTWPKLEDAAFILLAAYLVFRGRYFLAGFAAGLGYLCHPSALLAVPSLAGLAIALTASPSASVRALFRRTSTWTLRIAAMLGGLVIWLLIWRQINRRHFSQSEFVTYIFQADGPGINFGHWLKDRFDSFCNTVVPLNVVLFHSDRPGLNAVEGASPAVVHFNFQYWDAIPFGAGVGYFCCLLRQLYISWLKGRSYLLLVFVLPFLVYTIYWGSDNTGMLRTGLHPWFLGLLIASVFVWQRFQSHSQRFWKFANWALLSRIIGLIFILLAAPMLSQHRVFEGRFALSDIICILIMFAWAIWLCVYTFWWSENLRQESFKRTCRRPPCARSTKRKPG